MKINIVFLIFCLSVTVINAQEITNVVYFDDNGAVIEKAKKAAFFSIVYKYPDHFQRLDYKKAAPLLKERNYADDSLKILEGNYFEYAANGQLSVSGYYKNNLKEKSWWYYNDTGKAILEEKYVEGVLVKSINMDTVKKDTLKTSPFKKVEVEADFTTGVKGWGKYLMNNLNADLASKSKKGGTVRVAFVVDTAGICKDLYLRKSVEYVLDEEAKRVIRYSPPWIPAKQDGKLVNAYRIQPITFVKQ
ncbi:energy transducer TonB [Ferruginibacter sp. SUN002]|uniref:energy transducer TonB n=1 Tax=Ferruginibacter sp. SUN002 TaxID=2937789 RepID=UPI003D35DF78